MYVFQIKYTETFLSNNTRKPLWFEIIKLVIAVYEKKFIVSSTIIFGTICKIFQVKYKIWETLIFGDTLISLQHSGTKLPYQNQLDLFSRFDTHRLVTDRQTDRHTTTAYTTLAYRVAR